jgi:hypothetical protein
MGVKRAGHGGMTQGLIEDIFFLETLVIGLFREETHQTGDSLCYSFFYDDKKIPMGRTFTF